MDKPNNIELKAIAVVALFIFGGHILDNQSKQELKDTHEKVKQNFEPAPPGARNIDYKTGQWVMQGESKPNKVYMTEQVIHQDKFDDILSDEEIRILREKQSFKSGGSYIYTPGRNVPSYKELHDRAIEDYIDKHGEDIYDELSDKYGN